MNRSSRLATVVALGLSVAMGSLFLTPSRAQAERVIAAARHVEVDDGAVRLSSGSPAPSGPSVAGITESRAREMPRPINPDAEGRVTTMMTDGDLTMRVELTPRALGRSDYAVKLDRSDGRPYPDVVRVAFKFAMVGMDHGLFSQEGIPTDDGRYTAQGNDLIMEGAWYGWVLVELADGSLRGGLYTFGTGPARPSRIAGRVESGSPRGVRLVNVAVYADEPSALPAVGATDSATLVEIALAHSGACGGSVEVPALGLAIPFTDHGLAQIRIPPVEPQTMHLRCTPLGLRLE